MPSHEQWMRWCESGARIFSTCSRRSYMALILATDGRILGSGYNGAPSGLRNCSDGGCPRAATSVGHGSPYGNCVAVHAEANALLHSDRSARISGTLYVNGPPCWDCAKLIASSGIKTVVYKPDNAYADWPKCEQLLESVGINLVSCSPDLDSAGYPGGKIWLRQEQPVDLASSSGHRSSVDGDEHLHAALGDVLALGCDDGTYA